MIKGILITVKTKPVFFKGLDGQTTFDPQLYGSFLTAIDSFAYELGQERIQAILLGNSMLIYRRMDEVSNTLLIVIADRNIKQSKMKEIIDDLEDAFMTTFRIEQVVKHASEPNFFIPFEAALNIVMFKYGFQIVM